MATNESPVVRRKVVVGTERSLGIVFAAVFAIFGLWPVIGASAPRIWAIVIAIAFLASGLLRPQLLTPLNWLWFRIGLLLHHIVNPLIMAFLYYGVVVPTGLCLKAFGKDPLRLKRGDATASYWIKREPPGPAAGSMTKQF